jgi:hypothetical protein
MITDESLYVLDPLARSADDKELNLAIKRAQAAFEGAAGVCKKQQSELAGYYEDGTSYKAGLTAWQAHSAKLLNDSSTSASLLVLAATNLLGPSCITFDPDSLWSLLNDHHNIDLSHENRNKLLSAMLLLDLPIFLWDVDAFANTISAFADEIPDTTTTRPVSPFDLAWGVTEAFFLLDHSGMSDASLDREPCVYTAACLHDEGMIVPPNLLGFATESLEVLNRGGLEISSEEVRDTWDELDKSKLGARTFSETVLDTQLAKLAIVREHMLAKLVTYTKQASELTTTSSLS